MYSNKELDHRERERESVLREVENVDTVGEERDMAVDSEQDP